MTKCPKGLGPAGRALWRAVTDAIDLAPGADRVLLQACRLADQLDRLEDAAAAVPPVTTGSAGQDRVHPLYEEIRRHSDLLSKLVAQLQPAPATSSPSMSEIGSALAARRWGHPRRTA